MAVEEVVGEAPHVAEGAIGDPRPEIGSHEADPVLDGVEHRVELFLTVLGLGDVRIDRDHAAAVHPPFVA